MNTAYPTFSAYLTRITCSDGLATLSRHLNSEHVDYQDDNRPLTCPVEGCEKSFATNSGLWTHNQAVHVRNSIFNFFARSYLCEAYAVENAQNEIIVSEIRKEFSKSLKDLRKH